MIRRWRAWRARRKVLADARRVYGFNLSDKKRAEMIRKRHSA